MKTIIAISLLLPLTAAAQPAINDLKGAAGPDAVAASAAAPSAHGVPATPTRPADVVVSGEVIGTKKADIPEPISEHSPNWTIAVVRVAQVLKGAFIRPLREVEIYFPASQDVAWANAPKFQVGQVGVWSLKANPLVGGGFTALSPGDFHPAPGTERKP